MFISKRNTHSCTRTDCLLCGKYFTSNNYVTVHIKAPHTLSVEITAFLNAKTNVKKLQFGVEKCHQLHFGGKKNLCPDLHIDNWGVKKCNETKTGFANLVDEHLGDHKLKDVEEEKKRYNLN